MPWIQPNVLCDGLIVKSCLEIKKSTQRLNHLFPQELIYILPVLASPGFTIILLENKPIDRVFSR